MTRFSAQRVTTDTLEFSELELYPDALLMTGIGDRVVSKSIVPRAVAQLVHEAGENLVDFYFPRSVSPEDYRISLRPNARYWLVPNEILESGEIGNERNRVDVTTYEPGLTDGTTPVDVPGFTPVHKSSWDHQIWDIHGKLVRVPQLLCVWGTRFDLPKLKAHLDGHPNVRSFEIKRNSCWQNHEISGYELGWVVIDPRGLDLPSEAQFMVSWLEANLFNVGMGYANIDPLNVRQFRLPNRD